MDATQHFHLLRRYDRALNLRPAVEHAVRPGDRVLDAGCGAGVLSLWAVQAGAAEVVAVDLEGLELAEALAKENDLADSIRFVEGDLRSLEVPADGFDVILAMVYLNDPRRDEPQSRLVYDLRDRYLAPGGRMVPDRVRYLARACDWPAQDHPSRREHLRAGVADLEGRYGFSFDALADAMLASPSLSQFPPKGSDGRLRMEGARILSALAAFVEIDYTRGPAAYPETLELTATAPGVVNTVVWTQELWYADRLVFANESVSWIAEPQRVERGDRRTVLLDDDWRRSNVARIDT